MCVFLFYSGGISPSDLGLLCPPGISARAISDQPGFQKAFAGQACLFSSKGHAATAGSI